MSAANWKSCETLRKLRREIGKTNTADYFGKVRPRSATYREDPFYEPAPLPEPKNYRPKPPPE